MGLLKYNKFINLINKSNKRLGNLFFSRSLLKIGDKYLNTNNNNLYNLVSFFKQKTNSLKLYNKARLRLYCKLTYKSRGVVRFFGFERLCLCAFLHFGSLVSIKWKTW